MFKKVERNVKIRTKFQKYRKNKNVCSSVKNIK